MKATSPMVEGNMSKFESQISCSNPEENSCLNACVLLKSCFNVFKNPKTPNPLLSLALFRDKQMLSLEEFVDGSYHPL